MNLTHPAIMDCVPAEKVDFLDWAQAQGYKVKLDEELVLEGVYVRATLLGTHRGYDNAASYCALASTSDAAVAKLAAACSGRAHYPRVKLGFLWDHYGSAERFPRFV